MLTNKQTAVGNGAAATLTIATSAGTNRIVVAMATQFRGEGSNITNLTCNGVAGTVVADSGAGTQFRAVLSYWLEPALPVTAGNYAIAVVGSGSSSVVSAWSYASAKQAAPADPRFFAEDYSSVRSYTLSADPNSVAVLGTVWNYGGSQTVTLGDDQIGVANSVSLDGGLHNSSYDEVDLIISHTYSATELVAAVAAAIEPFADTAPTLSAGVPTGTGGANRTVGATTDKITGTARIVIDTSANLDAVTGPQVAAGQKEGSTPAAYDSGNITVSGTSFSYDFTGIAPGTWMAAAVHDGSAVLRWSFVVAAVNPGIKSPALQVAGVNIGAQTDVEYRVYAGHDHDGARLTSNLNGVIDSSSVFELDSDAVGDVGDPVTLALYYGDDADNASVVAKTFVVDLDA